MKELGGVCAQGVVRSGLNASDLKIKDNITHFMVILEIHIGDTFGTSS